MSNRKSVFLFLFACWISSLFPLFAQGNSSIEEAKRLDKEGKLSSAILVLRSGLKKNIRDAELWYYLSDCLFRIGHKSEAADALGLAKKIDPKISERLTRPNKSRSQESEDSPSNSNSSRENPGSENDESCILRPGDDFMLTLPDPGPSSFEDKDYSSVIQEFKAGGETAMEALRKLGIPGCRSEAVTKTLTECLLSGDDLTMQIALDSLGKIGPSAELAQKEILELTSGTDNQLIKFYGILALGKIHSDPESSLPFLIDLIDEDDSKFLLPALNSVVQYGKTAIPMLKTSLKKASGEKKRAIKEALTSLEKAE